MQPDSCKMGSDLKTPLLSRLLQTMQTGRAASKAILYDLDGTLVDHFTTIHRAITHAQQAVGAPLSSYDLVRATVGGSIEVTMTRLIGPELAPHAIPYYHEFFAKIMFEDLFAL